jgi:hypothetical protein
MKQQKGMFFLFESDSPHTLTHFSLFYNEENNPVQGKPLYLHEHPNLQLAFKVACAAVKELESVAARIEKG